MDIETKVKLTIIDKEIHRLLLELLGEDNVNARASLISTVNRLVSDILEIAKFYEN